MHIIRSSVTIIYWFQYIYYQHEATAHYYFCAVAPSSSRVPDSGLINRRLVHGTHLGFGHTQNELPHSTVATNIAPNRVYISYSWFIVFFFFASQCDVHVWRRLYRSTKHGWDMIVREHLCLTNDDCARMRSNIAWTRIQWYHGCMIRGLTCARNVIQR